jgi:hypothetical protein
MGFIQRLKTIARDKCQVLNNLYTLYIYIMNKNVDIN